MRLSSSFSTGQFLDWMFSPGRHPLGSARGRSGGLALPPSGEDPGRGQASARRAAFRGRRFRRGRFRGENRCLNEHGLMLLLGNDADARCKTRIARKCQWSAPYARGLLNLSPGGPLAGRSALRAQRAKPGEGGSASLARLALEVMDSAGPAPHPGALRFAAGSDLSRLGRG